MLFFDTSESIKSNCSLNAFKHHLLLIPTFYMLILITLKLKKLMNAELKRHVKWLDFTRSTRQYHQTVLNIKLNDFVLEPESLP